MNSFESYCDYIALKLHFKDWQYDYFLFRGHTNATPESFAKRKDRYWFEKLANLYSPHERILAHCCTTESVFIRNIVNDHDIFLKWQARQDSLTKIFAEEIKRLKKIFDSNFLFTPGSHPYIVREYLGGRISLETMTIISDLTDCVSYWGGHSEEDPIFEMVIRRIMKYTKFLDYDLEKFRKILIDSLAE